MAENKKGTVRAVDPELAGVVYPVTQLGPDIEYRAAPELSEIVEGLVKEFPAFEKLRELAIACYWKRNGRTERGLPKLGGVKRPDGLYRTLAGSTHFIVWLAADHLGDQKLTYYQVEALLFRLLCSCQIDEEGKLTLAAPEFSGFYAEIEEYGLWEAQLKRAGSIMRQPSLFEV